MPTTKTIVIPNEHSKQALDLFEKKIMANFVNGYTMTNYNLCKAMYQSINHEVSLRKEQL